MHDKIFEEVMEEKEKRERRGSNGRGNYGSEQWNRK
jgi:hypothetical protein